MELSIKIVGVIVSLFALYKIFSEVILAKASKYKEDYSFSKDFIRDLDDQDIHKFTKEKGFYALTGKSYDVPEIRHLLSYENATKAIRYRSLSQKFLNFENNKYRWSKKYNNQRFRSLLSYLYMIGYFVSAFLVLLPIYFMESEKLYTFPVIVFIVSFGIIAFSCLVNNENYKTSKELLSLEIANSEEKS